MGQNSTQKPQALQRSTTICTEPLAIVYFLWADALEECASR